MKKYICIEGIIGSGKTMLVNQIQKYFQQQNILSYALYEQFEQNKLLELFYQSPEKYNLLTEYSFLIDRFHQLYRHFSTFKEGITIADFSFRKCLWFAENNLSTEQFEEYKKHYFQLEQDLNQMPNKIIFLNVKPEIAYQNIQKRNRPMEKNITLNYLENLYQVYIKHVENSDIPVVIFNVDDYDKLIDEVLQVILRKTK